ncbi:MAG TPA: hypothetical protein VI432_01415 [Candidatus Paceibacterota bacterium]
MSEITPIIKVWCLDITDETELHSLHNAIVDAVIAIPELGVKSESDMISLYPPDLMRYGLGEAVIVEAFLFCKKQRPTDDVIDRLAKDLAQVIMKHCPKVQKTECFVNDTNSKRGVWIEKR